MGGIRHLRLHAAFFPDEVLKRDHLGFATPLGDFALSNYQQEALSFRNRFLADEQRDLSAWLGNDMQLNAIETL